MTKDEGLIDKLKPVHRFLLYICLTVPGTSSPSF